MRFVHSGAPALTAFLAIGVLAAGPALAGSGFTPYPGHARHDAATRGAQPRLAPGTPDTDLVVDDTGAGNLVRVPSDGSDTSVVASGFQFSYGVARDDAGNLYVTDGGAGTLSEVPADGSATLTLATGLNSPNGVVSDGAGDVYVAVYGDDTVVEYPAGGGDPVSLSSGSPVAGLALDADGDLYGASTDGTLLAIPTTTGGSTTTIASGLGFPTGVAAADDGSFHVTDYFGNTVNHVSADGATATPVGTTGGFSGPHRVRLDDHGNLYVVESGAGDVVEVPADGSAPAVVASGFTNPLDVLVVPAAPVVNPTITAAVTSATPRTTYGWYRSPVTVTFTCAAGSAPLTRGCPAPVSLERNVTNRRVSRTIVATDGGTATVVVRHIDIDQTRPVPHLVRKHGEVVCRATDRRSGVASCTVTKGHRNGKVVHTATAVDKAGNKRSITGQPDAG